MSALFGTLTNEDCEAAHAAIVSGEILDRLDVRLGTARCVEALKAELRPAVAVAVTVGDGSVRAQPERAGWRAWVSTAGEPAREGVIPWNNLANRATIRACERRRARGEELPRGRPEPVGQIALL